MKEQVDRRKYMRRNKNNVLLHTQGRRVPFCNFGKVVDSPEKKHKLMQNEMKTEVVNAKIFRFIVRNVLKPSAS